MNPLTIIKLIPLLALFGSGALAQPAYEIRAFAGRGLFGSADGPGAEASFSIPKNVAVSPDGTVYVTDPFNHTVRRITSGGLVSTLAGAAGSPGSSDGDGEAARFNSPFGVAVDPAGNVWVSDLLNHTLRRITSTGTVTTVAGLAGVAGSADGEGPAARFSMPTGLAVDPAGNVYLADAQNNAIRRISPVGAVTTVAGRPGDIGSNDGPPAEARFSFPVALAVDRGGNVYVADVGYDAIRKISAAGFVSTIAGQAGYSGSDDGRGDVARFSIPVSVAVDREDNVFVADSFNHTIRRVSAAGEVTTVAGRAGLPGNADGVGAWAQFNLPSGVAVNNLGHVLVADANNGRVRLILPTGEVSTLAGGESAGSEDGAGAAARFNFPAGVTADPVGNIYVADTLNHTIRQITPAGLVSTFAGAAGQLGARDGMGAAARFQFPLGAGADSLGNVYVTDQGSTVRKISLTGEVTTLAGQAGAFGDADGPGAAARFSIPNGVVVDPAGNVYVADQENSTIRKITPEGEVSTVAGLAGQRGGDDGWGQAARFVQPAGLALDAGGNLYVSDRGNFTLRKITPDGDVSTLAGQAGQPGRVDGTGGGARFSLAAGLAIDSRGTLYVADGDNIIRQVTTAGVVTTLFSRGPIERVGSDPRLQGKYFATSVAVDRADNVYVVDSGNNTVRKVVPATPADLSLNTGRRR